MNQVPASTLAPISKAASVSRVKMAAVRPKSLSFMRAMASSSLATRMTPTTGPKVSSVMTRMVWSTPIRICGAM